MVKTTCLLIGLTASILVLSGCDKQPEPMGEKLITVSKTDFESHCQRCHSLEVPLRRNKSLEGWRETVTRMKEKGLEVTPEAAENIAKYLASVRGK